MARPEITGRKPGATDPDPVTVRIRAPPPLAAYTVPQFCRAHGIGKTHYYALRKRGLGPEETRLLAA
jgi:hypothetical protein